MPRWRSRLRPLSQGAHSAVVYSVTGKRLATVRKSSGSAGPVLAGAVAASRATPARRLCTWPPGGGATGRSV